MAWKCAAENNSIPDLKADLKKAKFIERYRISENAVYFDGKYLPMASITRLCIQPSVYRPNHSCGKGIPVFKIRLDYGADKPAVLMLEREKNAEAVADKIQRANPAVIRDEYIDPITGKKGSESSAFLF